MENEEEEEIVYTFEDFVSQTPNCKRCYRDGHTKHECEYTTFRVTNQPIPLSHDIRLKILSVYHWVSNKIYQ